MQSRQINSGTWEYITRSFQNYKGVIYENVSAWGEKLTEEKRWQTALPSSVFVDIRRQGPNNYSDTVRRRAFIYLMPLPYFSTTLLNFIQTLSFVGHSLFIKLGRDREELIIA